MESMDRVTSFFQSELSLTSRVLLVAVALALLPSIFLPVWEIGLLAPQYPDGLSVVIYPNTVGGDLGEVNLLNHYIGMQEINAHEFPEFMFIPFFILRFLGFAVLAALVGRLPIAAIGYLDFVVFGAVMLFDFKTWLYEYGHNLSPDAPLTMEPFTPSMMGTTQIANFTVTSYPSAGAILMFVAGALGPVILLWEWLQRRKTLSAE
jgi:copper chaperone NosL